MNEQKKVSSILYQYIDETLTPLSVAKNVSVGFNITFQMTVL